MHYSSSSSFLGIFLLLLLLYVSTSQAQLSPSFYDETCPQVFEIATKTIVKALRSDPRIAASLLRLHFHDCFVNGCDASILLDNSTSFRTEKDANANANSARGFDVIDKMKASVEKACPNTVSCADLLAIAAQESVVLAGGPSWMVPCGRRDGLKGFMDLANDNLPAPFFTLKQLKDSFKKVGLDRPSDLVALSGGHTFGKNQCRFIMDRLYNFSGSGSPDPTLDKSYLKKLRKQCPLNGDQSVLLDLDFRTPTLFDNKYYVNLKENKGLIQSDQEIFSSPDASDTIPLVRAYADGKGKFFNAFVEAMIRMGNLSPLTGEKGEIRLNCRVVNSRPIIEDGVDADDCGSDDCVSVSDESISDDCVSDECVSSI